MKKIIITMLFAGLATFVSAQNQVGKFSFKPMAGATLSTFGSPTFDMYKHKFGFTAGAEVEYGVNSWLGASLGVLYSQQGAKIDGSLSMLFTDEDGKQYYSITTMKGKLNCSYLNLPILANIYIPAVKGLSLKTGIQIGILTGDKMEVEGANYTTELITNEEYYGFAQATSNKPNNYSYTQSLSGVTKSVDFGIPVGISYEYKNIYLDARYYFGLTKLDKTEDPDNARHRYLSLMLGYRFHL